MHNYIKRPEDGELVDRFERLAPGEDGVIDAADVRLIRKFRAKRDELILLRTKQK